MRTLRITAALAVLCGVSSSHAGEGDTWIFVSAPIFPQVCPSIDPPACTGGLYAYQGPDYPATLAAQEQLVEDASLTFDELLLACAPHDAGITLQQAEGPALTQEQLAANFAKTAHCANERYGVRPVWIPQLVDDVDICGQKLGPAWHLIRESELLALTEENRTFLHDTLADAASGDLYGTLYYSLTVYVRGDDGVLKLGTLEPGQSPRVWDLPIPEEERRYAGFGVGHSAYTTAALRCIRTTIAM